MITECSIRQAQSREALLAVSSVKMGSMLQVCSFVCLFNTSLDEQKFSMQRRAVTIPQGSFSASDSPR